MLSNIGMLPIHLHEMNELISFQVFLVNQALHVLRLSIHYEALRLLSWTSFLQIALSRQWIAHLTYLTLNVVIILVF